MKSLRGQLTLRLLMGGMLLLILGGTIFRWQIHRALIAELDRSVMATFQTMTMLVEQKNGHLKIELTDTDVSQLEDPHGNVAFLLQTPAGEEIMRSVSLGSARLPCAFRFARGSCILQQSIARWPRDPLRGCSHHSTL